MVCRRLCILIDRSRAQASTLFFCGSPIRISVSTTAIR